MCGALRTITPSRASVLRIMSFCIDNASYAEHITCILRDSICDNVPYFDLYRDYDIAKPFPPLVKIARMYVVNDLLFNADNGCSTPYHSLLSVGARGGCEG